MTTNKFALRKEYPKSYFLSVCDEAIKNEDFNLEWIDGSGIEAAGIFLDPYRYFTNSAFANWTFNECEMKVIEGLIDFSKPIIGGETLDLEHDRLFINKCWVLGSTYRVRFFDRLKTGK